MRQQLFLVLAVPTCCILTLLASPCLADVAGVQAEGPIGARVAPAKCGTLTTTMGTPEPLFMTCTVQVECSDGTIKSCSGNSCSTSGYNGRCVTCNGVQVGTCCPTSCCEDCATAFDQCASNCGGGTPKNCNMCNFGYQNCVADCTGGCS